MSDYDHEDAFKDANLCAGRRTNLPEVLRGVKNKELAMKMIRDTQDIYLNIFEAFIEGVAYGRKNPSKDSAT